MICQKCGKNEASVHLTRIINGEKEELHLCESCAKKSDEFSFHSDNNFTFQSLLSGVLNNSFSDKNKSILKDNLIEENICGNCGLSYLDFSKSGLFGCSDCYDKFEDKLDPLFKRIHGSNRHTGKKPSKYKIKKDTEKEIDLLKAKMEEAVEKENFEEAAEIRDRIHEIKKNMEEDINESHNS
jgi:protein arginine kinase activator